MAEGFRLEPLTRGHVGVDYAAVMSSKETLRVWSGTTWPEEGFTMGENLLADLDRHEREHVEGVAFTYTVLGDDECLGCVYVTALDRLRELNPDLDAPAGSAVVGFWAVEPKLAGGLEKELFEALRGWFTDAWSFPAVYFSGALAGARQMGLFEAAGLPESFRVRVPGRQGLFGLYRLT